MMAESAATFMSESHKGERNVANTAMVLTSLASTLPLVMPDATVSLDYNGDVQGSPKKERTKKSKGVLSKHFPRPRSPRLRHRSSHSDPESSASPGTSPQLRPRWLPIKNRKKKNPSPTPDDRPLNAACLSVTVSGSMPALNFDTTQVHRLPGRSPEGNSTHENTNDAPEASFSEVNFFPSRHSADTERLQMDLSPSRSSVPKIRVSNESNEDVNDLMHCEENEVTMDNIRKNSLSSRCSIGSGQASGGTSGVGSLLSPSGDESYPSSDLESPSSPYSVYSSFTSDTPGELSDSDPIEKDYYAHSKDSVTTPTPPHGDAGSPTFGEGKDLKSGKNRKDAKMKVCLVGKCQFYGPTHEIPATCEHVFTCG